MQVLEAIDGVVGAILYRHEHERKNRMVNPGVLTRSAGRWFERKTP